MDRCLSHLQNLSDKKGTDGKKVKLIFLLTGYKNIQLVPGRVSFWVSPPDDRSIVLFILRLDIYRIMEYFRHKWTFKAVRFVSIILASGSQQSRLHSLLSYMHQAVSGVSCLWLRLVGTKVGFNTISHNVQPNTLRNEKINIKINLANMKNNFLRHFYKTNFEV